MLTKFLIGSLMLCDLPSVVWAQQDAAPPDGGNAPSAPVSVSSLAAQPMPSPDQLAGLANPCQTQPCVQPANPQAEGSPPSPNLNLVCTALNVGSGISDLAKKEVPGLGAASSGCNIAKAGAEGGPVAAVQQTGVEAVESITTLGASAVAGPLVGMGVGNLAGSYAEYTGQHPDAAAQAVICSNMPCTGTEFQDQQDALSVRHPDQPAVATAEPSPPDQPRQQEPQSQTATQSFNDSVSSLESDLWVRAPAAAASMPGNSGVSPASQAAVTNSAQYKSSSALPSASIASQYQSLGRAYASPASRQPSMSTGNGTTAANCADPATSSNPYCQYQCNLPSSPFYKKCASTIQRVGGASNSGVVK